MKEILMVVFLLVAPGLLYSQKSNKDKKYSSKSGAAIKLFEQGQDFYDRRQDERAVDCWEKAIQADARFIEPHIMLAGLYSDNKQTEDAIREYKNAIAINPDFFPNLHYSLAVDELSIGKYEDAFKDFQKYLSYPVTNSGTLNKTKKYLKVCEFGINAVKNPVPFDLKSLGDSVNTMYGEYSPAITADERFLFFTRMKEKPAREEDIYVSERKNGKWSIAINLGEPVNTETNEGTVNIAPDGQTLYFAASGRPDGFGALDIYEVKRIGSKWGQPHNLGPAVNTNSYEGQPSIASDGRTLYFTSNRQGGMGTADIWMTYKKENGEWTRPVNLGKPVNTEGVEQSPFIHPDNGTLYFSSDGHPGMGLTDFFFSRKNSLGDWQTPVNLGYPINTHADERNIIVNAKGDLAYIASDRKKKRDDFDLFAFELYPEARPVRVSYLKGVVYDQVSKLKVEARFEVIDLASGKTIAEASSNKITGEFLVCLAAEKNYALNVSAPGYLFYSDHFSLKDVVKTEAAFLKDIPLQPVRKGESVILRNIFFETNSFLLKDESKIELKKLTSFLEKNPSLKIEISGHTDNTGEASANIELSKNRARSVQEHLIANGIQASRMTFKGFGSSKPIAGNDTAEGKAANRRTEFKIIE